MMIQTVNTVLLPLRATLWLSGTALSLSWKVGKWTWKSVWGQNKPEKEQAVLADYATLKKAGHLTPNGGIYIGNIYRHPERRIGRARVYALPHQSVNLIGQKGSGKTQSVIADQRAVPLHPKPLWWDVLCIDPVGEIEKACAPRLKKLGYRTLRIDLNEPTRGMQFDPLRILKPGMAQYDYMLAHLGDSIVPQPVKPGQYDHFPNGARAALMGMIAYAQHNHEMKDKCTLAWCMDTIADEKVKIKDLIELMRLSPSPFLRNNVKALTIISEREYGSFVSTMTGYFGPFLADNLVDTYKPRYDPETGEVFDGIDFLDIFRGDVPTAIYVRTGNNGPKTGALARLILSNAVNTKRWLMNQWEEGERYEQCRGLHRPLRIYTDETKNLGNASALVDANDELRKARVTTFTPWLTSADMLNSLASAKNLTGGSVNILAGANTDYETMENFSRLFGEKIIHSQGGSFSRGGSSESYHEQYRRLMPVDKLRGIPFDQRAVIAGQLAFVPHNPFFLPQKKLFGLVRKPLRY